jgi:transposase
MKQTCTARQVISHNRMTLYMALELSAKTWRLAFGDGARERQVALAAWDQVALAEALIKAKRKFDLPDECRVLSVQEAGRDGFSIHRFLESLGVESLVVDSSSIEVKRRARRAKTDRLDATKLLSMLRRYDHGERKVWSVLHVPTAREEDERHPHRERDRLTKERTALGNRLRSLLATVGCSVKRLDEDLATWRQWDGTRLPASLQDELVRLRARRALLEEQLLVLREQCRLARKTPAPTRAAARANQLMVLKGIGEQTSWILSHEFFWRDFRNRKEVAAAAGLCPSPYASGESSVEQGISKAGNARTRALLIETAWLWQRLQPDSALSRWFQARFGPNGKRLRRVGIVALARRLLVALWRFLETGELPEGAVLKSV